ncbi:uncharacterized protein LOC113294405 [Papaver somniferum]|uniref:uncharacterized protein LOC113294405 n=1 Tax=Papaver somniferum TaxID=3469 RepID=UPI000E70147E|nr:uncharacterized protein LOC113294405 [Papaver somniferum]
MSQRNQQNNAQAISNLETQISQLSNLLNDRENGTFPSQTTPNPKGVNQVNGLGSSNHNEHIKAVITLRSGKTLENSVEPPKDKSPDEKENEVDQTSSKDLNGPESAKSPSGEDIPERMYIPPAPFPQRLAKKKPSTYAEILKQVKINLPLLDAIKHVPVMAKFLKEMCTVKRDASVHKAFLTQQVSSIISQKYPVKFKDPGCPTVTCVIGSQKIENALLDLGGSVNLLSFSVYEQLGLGEMKPTRITLQLADRSVKIPRGIIEDVLVQALQAPPDPEHYESICMIDSLVENTFTTNSVSDTLEACLAHFGAYYDEDSHFKEVNALLDSAPVMNYGKWQHYKLSELEEIRNDAYQSAKIYKEQTKIFHDKSILRKTFEPVEVENPKNGETFKVNGQRLKPFLELPSHAIEEPELRDPVYQD